MKVLGWEEKYEIGVGKIDEQNKIMLAILNSMLKIFMSPEYSPNYLKMYATLLMYARKNFAVEEKLMREIKYTQYHLHKNQHEEFINKMEFFNQEYLNGENIAFEFQRYILKWYGAHIQIADKKYVPLVFKNSAVKAEFVLPD
ncbi:MAG: bacteriohemerythrin [Rhodothermaceae bacterium]